MQVSVLPGSTFDKVFNYFSSVDRTGVRYQTQQNMADAAVYLFDRGYTNVASLFATPVVGGRDRNGLFPDYNRDNRVTLKEWKQLAATDFVSSSISGQDFQSAFGNAAVAGGVTVDWDRLRRLASGGSEPAPQPTPQPTNSYDSVLKALYQSLQQYFQRF